MSLINYNLQQEQQTATQTGEPVGRYEYAQGLKEFTDTVVPIERAFFQGYEQQKKKNAQSEDEVLLNQYRDKAYRLKKQHEIKENPSEAEFQDDLNSLKNEFPTVAANKMYSVDKEIGIKAVTPSFIQAKEITEKTAAEQTAEVNKSYYNLGVDYLGLDKASSMTPDAVIQQGKIVAADGEALSSAINSVNNPNSSDTVIVGALQTISSVASKTVGEAINNNLDTNKMITQADLDKAKEDIVTTSMKRGLTPSQATWVANRAVFPYQSLADLKDATLEDQKKISAQINSIIKTELDSKMMEATGVTSDWFKGLSESPWLLSSEQREALRKSAQGAMADFEGNKALINSLSNGNPLDLTRLGENLDKALRDPIYTDRQKAIGINAATQALGEADAIPPKLSIDMALPEIRKVIADDVTTAIANFNWLNNKYQENAGAIIDTVNKSDTRSKVGIKNDYTATTLETINKKLLQGITDTQGILEYSNGVFKSSVPVDDAFVNELNKIVESAEITNTITGNSLLDKEALNRGIQTTLRNYKLDKTNNMRGDQKAALLFMPVLAAGQASRTERQQALLGNKIEEEPWLKTFQAGLTGVELGGAAAAAASGGAGVVPGVIVGGLTGLTGGAFQNFPALREFAEPALNPSRTLSRVEELAGKTTRDALEYVKDYLKTSVEMLQKGVADIPKWVDDTALKITKALIPDAGATEVLTIPNSISEGKIKQLTEDRIKAEEGLRLKVYKDSKGLKTIGYGTKLKNILEAQGADAEEILSIIPDVTTIEEKGITEEQAQGLLDLFLSKAELDAERFVGAEVFANLSEARQQALIDMAYNLGGEGLGKFKMLRQRIQEGNFNRAALSIERSDYNKQNSKRAKRNKELMKSGTF